MRAPELSRERRGGPLGAWLRSRSNEAFAGCGYGKMDLGAAGVVCSGVDRATRGAV